MLILGIESSCDETGVALFDNDHGLLAHALHSQITIHAAYGGVVPELASRDHIRRLVPLLRAVLEQSGSSVSSIDAIAYTRGPGLAGSLLVGAAFAEGLATALGVPTLPLHHLEGHLLSPLLSSTPPEFPFIALLVSGGHTQLMRVTNAGNYELLGETLDDAAGEAFDKSAKLLGLDYPGGPALAQLAEYGRAGTVRLPRPLLHSGDFNFSFSGLKTAARTAVDRYASDASKTLLTLDETKKADIAHAVQAAIVEVLVQKALAATQAAGLSRLVVAGGVGANRELRRQLDTDAGRQGIRVFYPELEFCTDNGAMIAFAGALLLASGAQAKCPGTFAVQPRWSLAATRRK